MSAVPDDKRLQDAARAPDGPRLALLNGADVTPEPVHWLVRDWLAAGKLHVLGGAPGAGKTTIALAFAAAITVGGRWPGGERVPLGDVLIWSGEDSAEDTLIPRLMACGGNRARVYVVGDVIEPRPAGDTQRAFDPATDMGLLMAAASELPALRLVIVDPIVSAVAGDSHKNAEVRRGLAPLVELGARTGAAVVGITHLSKGSIGRDPVERLTGSLAFGALARVVMVAARLPNEGGDVRALLRAKNNIGRDDGGFRYRLRHDELDGHPGVVASRIEWGEPIEGGARDVLAEAEAASDEPHSASTTDEAADWLRAVMADHPNGRVKREIVEAAAAVGFKERTIERARQKARIGSRLEGFGRNKQALWFRLDADAANAAMPAMPAIRQGSLASAAMDGAPMAATNDEPWRMADMADMARMAGTDRVPRAANAPGGTAAAFEDEQPL